MVSRKQLVLIGLAAVAASAQSRKFYLDDPLSLEPTPLPVKQVAVRKVDDIYDFLENSYVTPKREGKAARLAPRLAADTNTLGEVPDSTWYTNRHATKRMSIEELQRGPGNSTPPDPRDTWKVVGAKNDGVTPGFVIEDRNKRRYLLKLDPVGHPELCSAADVIGSKFFYALGYFTPENYVVHFRRENLAISPGVQWRDAKGRKHPLTRQALSDMLDGQRKTPDGKYRALASKWLEGEVVGPFSYRGVRSDDPNDLVPHEDRRTLRGLAVFAAWLNHHDTRSINSMDTLVVEHGRKHLKHFLIDFGSILGSAGYGPKEAWIGHEHSLSRRPLAKQFVTFGFLPPRWTRAEYPKLTGVGLFDSWSFEPLTWKSNYPNPAFLMMDDADAFWAAKQVAVFTDDEIRAIVQTGQYSDPRATKWIADCLVERRDKIKQVWYSRALPVDRFRVDGGRLAFDNLGAAREFDVAWSVYDNDRNHHTPIASASGWRVPASNAEFLAASITAKETKVKPVVVYMRAGRVVGVDR